MERKERGEKRADEQNKRKGKFTEIIRKRQRRDVKKKAADKNSDKNR